jgi:hypothetical protein
MLRTHASVLILLLPLMVASTAETTDFSGSYAFTPAKHASKTAKDITETLTVMQTATDIVVTRVANGKSYTNTFPLDGREGIYYTENHTKGTCKGHFKGNQLFLDATIATRPLENGLVVIIRFKERWQLSPDLKTLKIHEEAENPQLSFSAIEPWTDIYTRN